MSAVLERAVRADALAAGRLLHYSAKPVSAVHSVAQKERPDMKPRGFWISVEGEYDWPSWCQAESYQLESLASLHEVILHDDARILRIVSPYEIDDFHEEYSAPPYPDWPYGRDYIDWRKVAASYQGIIIAPYQWSRRLEGNARWYYSWDCASGCIWEAAAIASIRSLP